MYRFGFNSTLQSARGTFPYVVEVGLLSDTGQIRSRNQDHIGIVNFSDNKNILAILADGMGGAKGGEIASLNAIEAFRDSVMLEFKKISHANFNKLLLNAIQSANERLFFMAQKSPELQGMGTTLVAIVIYEGYAYYTNVGDSRLYLLRNNKLILLSEDHTLVSELVKKGLITQENATKHPDRHVITRAIGTQDKVVSYIPNSPLLLQPGDRFVLCSDGLYELVPEVDMIRIIQNCTPQQACQQLVDLANLYGGTDNISIILLNINDTHPLEKRVTRITKF